MRVEIHNAAGTVVLCAGEAEDQYPSDASLNWRELIQEEPFLRGAAQKVFGRQNFGTGISFSVLREHASHKEACAWETDHLAAIQTVANGGAYTVKLTYEHNGSLKIREITDCRVAEFSSRTIGLATISSYRLAGGILQGLS